MITKRWGVVLASVLCAVLIGGIATEAHADPADEAYALNQEAMEEMSMAQFESAGEKFLRAARLVPDYQIRGRALRYTPTFMAAWASEKEGHRAEACRTYQQFHEIAPVEFREATKVEHAEQFLARNCGS